MPSENRFHEILLNYWNDLREGRPFPEENEFDPEAIKEIWPNCFLISLDAVTERLGYRYSYLGTNLIEAYGEAEPTLSPGLSQKDMPLVHQFDKVRETKNPATETSTFTNKKNLKILYRASLAPLGFKNDITHLVGCMRWKVC